MLFRSPAKTPKETVSQISAWFTTALQAAAVRDKLASLGQRSLDLCGADFGAFIRKQHEDYGRIIREANIRIN